MNNKENKKHPIRWLLPTVITAIVVCGSIYSYFGGWGTGKCADTEEFAKYAGTVTDIALPDSVRIVALGEATHGNAEFQRLKLDVFKVMVGKYGVRAFALESDFGGCEAVNRYIHGGKGTAGQAAAALGFPIYQTKEMADLIEWMRQYNLSAEPGDDIRFYGFDMQRYEYSYEYLLEAAKKNDLPTADLEKLWDSEKNAYSATFTPDQKAKVIEAVKQDLLQLHDSTAAQAVHFADILLQNISLGKVQDNMSKGLVLRDSLMTENTLWILAQEEARGNGCIFITGHNGHIERRHDYGKDGKAMGALLANQLGNAYFAIGTDFHKARVNIPKLINRKKRSNHTFYSHDPLAKAAKKCGFETCWLDFSRIPDNSPLKTLISGYTWLGDVGDGYNPMMAVLPMSYRDWECPSELYNGMIFIANAQPIIVQHVALPTQLH